MLRTVAVLAFLPAAGVHAAALTYAVAPRTAGLGGTVGAIGFVTPAVGNDTTANGTRANPNTLTVVKTYTNPAPGATIDIEFTVACIAGTASVSEYVVTEWVTNATGLPMTELDLFVGFGGVRPGEVFLLSPDPDGLDFDQEGVTPGGDAILDDPFPFSNVFTRCDLCVRGDGLFFKGGPLMPGQTAMLFYQLDVPEVFEVGIPGSGVFNIPPGFGVPLGPGQGGYRFTLQQIPTFIPLPPALVLFTGSLVILVAVRRAGTPNQSGTPRGPVLGNYMNPMLEGVASDTNSKGVNHG
jgi:hypothetical protein